MGFHGHDHHALMWFLYFDDMVYDIRMFDASDLTEAGVPEQLPCEGGHPMAVRRSISRIMRACLSNFAWRRSTRYEGSISGDLVVES